MKIRALDINNAEYVDVNISQVQMDKKGRIKSLMIDKDGFDQVYRRKGKSIFYTTEESLSINEGDLKGVLV